MTPLLAAALLGFSLLACILSIVAQQVAECFPCRVGRHRPRLQVHPGDETGVHWIAVECELCGLELARRSTDCDDKDSAQACVVGKSDNDCDDNDCDDRDSGWTYDCDAVVCAPGEAVSS